jgi:nucleotide-binding universal stress UspA family protein
MKKILVPTDFSSLSKVAVLFAVSLSKKMDAEIVIASVIGDEANDKSLPRWKKLEHELEKAAEENAAQMIREIKVQVKYDKISYISIKGFPLASAIDEYATANNVDLIVIGTHGASGLKKVVMGSNAAAVIDNSSIPVITIPGKTNFRPLKKIVYATDLTNIGKEIKAIVSFSKYFDSEIYILHVLPSDSEKSMREIKAETSALDAYSNVHLQFVKSDNIAESVEEFVSEVKADLLITFTHKLDFYEKLMGRSVTRELAFHSEMPLLTFNKTTSEQI